MSRLISWLLVRPPDKLVFVKSWRPWLGPYGIEWPTMLIDRFGRRRNAAPVWNWALVRSIFRRTDAESTP